MYNGVIKMLRATNIIWDVDDAEDLKCLPEFIDTPIDITDEDEISDYLSDTTGFCHKGFCIEERKDG